MPVDEEPRLGRAPTISEILAGSGRHGAAGGADPGHQASWSPHEQVEDVYGRRRCALDGLRDGRAEGEGRDRQAPVDRRGGPAPLTQLNLWSTARAKAAGRCSRAAEMPGREGKQCRERWFNFLRPSVDKSAWTERGVTS